MRKNTSPRLTREDWLWGAFDLLANKGVRFRIDDLVTNLGVTKGSFYWHFKNREDFINSLLSFWAVEFTENAGRRITELGGTPEERLYALMELVLREKYSKYDVAIRSLAVLEPQIAKVVRTVDEFRLNYVRSLFREMGFTGDELEMRTRTLVIFSSFQFGLSVNLSIKKEKKLLKLRYELLVKK